MSDMFVYIGDFGYTDDSARWTRTVPRGADPDDVLNDLVNEAMRSLKDSGNEPPYEFTLRADELQVVVELRRPA